MKNESDLRIKDGFHSYMKEDSKSLAQAGMLTEINDVDNLRILIEEVRLDQDIKAQVLFMSFYVNLSIGCHTIKGDATSVV